MARPRAISSDAVNGEDYSLNIGYTSLEEGMTVLIEHPSILFYHRSMWLYMEFIRGTIKHAI